MKRLLLFVGFSICVFMFASGQSTAMTIFDKLFGGKGAKVEDSLSDHREYIDSLRSPAIRIEKRQGVGLSKIGGLPLANKSLLWPQWKGKPLSFLCQIDLAELPQTDFAKSLPRDGILYFFYDQEQSTWGFDPKDRGSLRVIYIDNKDDIAPVEAPAGLSKDYIYKEKYITFSDVLSYPDWQDERIEKLNLNDDQFDEYTDLRTSIFGNQPVHQMFGYPIPIQGNDMDLESQLVSNGLYCGDSTGYHDPLAKKLESGRHDWVMLLQLDSDDDTGMMWGDVGTLYFWIRKEDLEKKNFNDVWMILQCS